MKKQQISKEDKIKLFKAAKKIYSTGSQCGLCSTISEVINTQMVVIDGIDSGIQFWAYRQMPEFTITNARKLATKYKFKHPIGRSGWFWWPLGEKKARLQFLDALIKETKIN